MAEPLCITFKSHSDGLNTGDTTFFKTMIQHLIKLDELETGITAIETPVRERWADTTISWEVMGDPARMEHLLQQFLRNSPAYFQRMEKPVKTEHGPATQFIVESP